MNRFINNYSEYIICELINKEPLYGNILYEKAVKYIDVQRITIYKILERLAEKGTIEVIDSTQKRKYYRLTEQGKSSLYDSRQIYPRINLNDYNNIGENVVRIDTIDSTSSFILLNKESLKDGDIVVANKQLISDRRKGNALESSPETLEFSFYMKPNYEFEKTFYIGHVLVSSLVSVLVDYDVDPKIEWNGEVYANNKLLATYDINALIKDKKTHSVVCSISLNIDNEETKDATSIFALTNKSIEFEKFLEKFCDKFNLLHQQLIVSNFSEIIEIYRKHLDITGTSVLYHDFEFDVIDVTEQGNLIVTFNEELMLIPAHFIKLCTVKNS